MNCSEFKKSLDNYALIDAEELADMECHAEKCDICRSELEFYKSIIQTAASIPVPEPPADLIDKVNARIDSEPRLNRTVNNIVWNVRNNVRRYATLAACLAVGLTVGLNSGVIKDNLTGSGDDGIISERSVSATQTPNKNSDSADTETDNISSIDEPSPTEYDPQTTQNAEPTKKPITEAASVSAEKKLTPQVKKTEAPKPTYKTVVKAPSVSLPVKTAAPTVSVAIAPPTEKTETVIKTPAPEVNNITEAPAINSRETVAAPEETPAETEKSISKYTIARANYYIPEAETAKADTVTEEPSPEEYEIKKAGYQIAQGDYSGNVKEAEGVSSASISDKIVVSKADADAVANVISSLGIPSNNGFYTTVSATFYELLARLDAEGISYSYSLQYSSGDKVVFKLVMR